jgi:hypothetical protein
MVGLSITRLGTARQSKTRIYLMIFSCLGVTRLVGALLGSASSGAAMQGFIYQFAEIEATPVRARRVVVRLGNIRQDKDSFSYYRSARSVATTHGLSRHD